MGHAPVLWGAPCPKEQPPLVPRGAPHSLGSPPGVPSPTWLWKCCCRRRASARCPARCELCCTSRCELCCTSSACGGHGGGRTPNPPGVRLGGIVPKSPPELLIEWEPQRAPRAHHGSNTPKSSCSQIWQGHPKTPRGNPKVSTPGLPGTPPKCPRRFFTRFCRVLLCCCTKAAKRPSCGTPGSFLIPTRARRAWGQREGVAREQGTHDGGHTERGQMLHPQTRPGRAHLDALLPGRLHLSSCREGRGELGGRGGPQNPPSPPGASLNSRDRVMAARPTPPGIAGAA